MRIQKATLLNELLAKVIFLLLPTLLICYFVLWNANHYYSILNNQSVRQTLYVAMGMGGAALLYALRFRFIPSFLALALLLYVTYKGIDASSFGEFDTFFLSIQFRVFSITFLAGWVIGWGFTRLRFFSIFISAVFLGCCMLLIAKRNELFFSADSHALEDFLRVFAPVVLYAVYIIFTAELIRNYKDKGQKFWWFVSRRLVMFAALAVLLLGGVVYLMSGEIKETLSAFGGGGQEGQNSMLKKKKDNTFDLEQYTRLRGSLGRSNELLFAAHIDHFFEGTDIPNPLYLTAFYYSRFDTLTETFERDSLIPANDLFEPDPSRVPLFFTKTDSSVLSYALKEKGRRTVEIEVYKKQLSPNTFIAPSTSFFVQPITVEKDFQNEFRSAYRAKSYISELNSAYFVYNAGDDPQVARFQEQRFAILRDVKDYAGVDKELMDYYTYMPSDAKFNRIRTLAEEVTKGKTLPVDQILAIRDYFLSKDENGDPLFSYTDNPGVPDIPDASKLQYFLFENRKGYCAYYAGATLFMLRALGIPSRITVGFMTVDRSDKNKGWYWYYADQAHAWVQVYFPGFGWLDFDTTVGNEDAEQSPAPDGTPPMQPPKAYLAADGVVSGVDTLQKQLRFQTFRMVFHDQEYIFPDARELMLDMSIASVRRDSIDIPLAELHAGDSATAVSYAEAFKNMKPNGNTDVNALVNKFPDPAPIDELHVKPGNNKEQQSAATEEERQSATNWKAVLTATAISIGIIALILLLLPRIIYAYYRLRYRMANAVAPKSYWAYRASGFYLHMLGYAREERTALQFAGDVDNGLGTKLAAFITSYLKLKYAGQPLPVQEQEQVLQFLPSFLFTVKQQVSFRKRFLSFFRLFRAIGFYGPVSES